MGKYTTVLWDLDQTLLDFNRAMNCALRATCERYELYVDDEIVALYAAINQSFWKRLEMGELNQQEVAVGRFRTLFQELKIGHIKPEEFNKNYHKELGSVYFYMEGAKELVTALKQKGYRQYIVTNGMASTQESKLRRSGLDQIMDGVFISERLGYPKPMKGFFDACFAALPQIKREECILVGDSLSSDMRGANNAGVAACWFNPDRKAKEIEVRTDYEIHYLQELLPILEQE
ncbi:MAG: YjjG family noncanonical pyrimidine nucleotidase [Lachnospiraceae bacterium]|nr:YjjG family noncanonical pyrimidine nucleotidase [Lachnospiraceae bacterium]